MRKLTAIVTAMLISCAISPAFAAGTCSSNISNYETCTATNSTENATGNTTENAAIQKPTEATSYEELMAQYKKALAEYNSLKAELEKEEKELAMLKAQEAELEQRYNALSSDVEALKQEIEYRKQLEAKIAELKAKLAKAGNKVEMLRRKFMALPKSYRVVRGDTLWGIASKSYIYNDPWQWPLIYRANRNKIKNPHLIFPKQVFTIPRNITAEEVIDARRQALRTPPPPGAKVIKVGPVRAEDVPKTATDYFLFMNK
ncbi:LysM peptidoglycan-binding domain-containing protein [Desulfurobacterium sp. TC5-1]|uniref:LysM peptidoglycan-binding domain-containing protein n=1 Tax=Desulfurobacterium sp. TC5-1 TaxID=1158318 RepID=UPI0003B6BFB9|nr:LysM peptidoglycan-binding domain-containing protein [Desulfurobacterium sp. TC5-1]